MRDELDRPENWKTLGLAFILWAGHFAIVYGAELIMPGDRAVRWIALSATLAAMGAFFLIWRRLDQAGLSIARLSLGIAALAIAYQTLPALIG